MILKELLVCSCVLLGFVSSAQTVETAINRIISTDQLSICSNELLEVGNELIGAKSHRLLNTSTDSNQIVISGVLNYNDRPSHVTISAHKNLKGQCVIRYQLNYQLDTPCLSAREEVFKKWLHQGKLDDNTHVYQHKRDAGKTAHLSDISRGTQCLVTSYFNTSLSSNTAE